MKKKNKRPLPATTSRDAGAELASRLLAYSTAAGVTLALAPEARGAIVATSTNVTLAPPQSFFVNITGGTNALDPTFEFVGQSGSLHSAVVPLVRPQTGKSSTTFNILPHSNGVLRDGKLVRNVATSATIGTEPAAYWSLSQTLLLAQRKHQTNVNTWTTVKSTWVPGPRTHHWVPGSRTHHWVPGPRTHHWVSGNPTSTWVPGSPTYTWMSGTSTPSGGTTGGTSVLGGGTTGGHSTPGSGTTGGHTTAGSLTSGGHTTTGSLTSGGHTTTGSLTAGGHNSQKHYPHSSVNSSGTTNGAFAKNKGMVGVRFNFNGSTHYGWIAFEANLNKTNSATITGWAYETIPGKPIAAGDTNAVPELNASNLTFSAVATNQMTLNWVPGDGVRRMVVAHADTAVSWTPTDGNAYPANTNLASAADVGGGNCVVYDGSDSNITVTGLDPNRVYCFKVFEYYGTDDPSSYLYLKTGIPAANSQLTLASAAAPLQIQSIFNAGSSSFQLQWQSSSGKKYGVWRTTDLSLAFTRIATGIDATPPTNNYTDQTAPAQQAFYKIEEE